MSLIKKIAIIGSRDLSSFPFDKLVEETKRKVLEIAPDGKCILISGGSSWADFVAVELKRQMPQCYLRLYIPSKFDNGRFVSTPGDNNAWSTLNHLHSVFKQQTGIDSLEIMKEMQFLDGVAYITKNGFLKRNDYIANVCDHLIALSHGTNEPDTPGTLYTWKKALEKERMHITIPEINK